MNRIKKVEKIVQDARYRTDWTLKTSEEFARQICQLFPQPLFDTRLSISRKQERERICGEIEKHFGKEPIAGDILISLNDLEWQALKGEE